MRSRAEVLFRLRQEAGNLRLRMLPPWPRLEVQAPLSPLPPPQEAADAVRGTLYAEQLVRTAESILAHRFPLLGLTIETGPDIQWRRDYSSGITSPRRYFRLIPYLDARRAGDHKVFWELNRHPHWVTLAQAFRLTGRREFLDEIERQFNTWLEQNPFLKGINWTSALEVAFRALSWTWVIHLAGEELDPKLLERMAGELRRHGCYIDRNLSVYFSPNTHLLGEAVALHALGALFPCFPRAWAERGARIVREQMEAQVREDGSHFEQSSYYHLYALDMFLFHALLAETPPSYRERLARMAGYLADLAGPARCLPFLGDDDGGRFFHPFGARDAFGRATLATAAALLDLPACGVTREDACEQAVWWLGAKAVSVGQVSDLSRTGRGPVPLASRVYRDAGVGIMVAGDVHIVADAGPFGPSSAGHSHSDTLSLVVRAGDEEVLIDPGAYTSVADPGWRDRFRGSAMHNTVRIAGRDQAVASGPFRWSGYRPVVELREWVSTAGQDYLDAVCSYSGFRHRRRIAFRKPDLLVIVDDIDAPEEAGVLVEQFWHPGCRTQASGQGACRIGRRATLVFAPPLQAVLGEGGDYGWRSPVFGVKTPAPVIRVGEKVTGSGQFAAVLDLSGWRMGCQLGVFGSGRGECHLEYEAGRSSVLRFGPSGPPD